ncbi:phosphatase PAP2 family protein [Microvirga sp. 2MCAF38]|uniref:phosphatase PAP2 family protein n=1 Tax=Microvirga sp. 2MCAF38 TaxID=3232989 RepID=UPI003F9B92AB
MTRNASLLLVALLAISTVPALQAEAKDKPHFAVTIDTTAIGTPPDATTAARDMQAVLSAQAERTPVREELAIRDARQTLSGFLEEMNADIDKDELKKARRLFKDATKALEKALAPVKGRFERPRPFKANSDIKTCATKLPPSSSFPSTHAGTGTLYAALLTHVAPEKTAELEKRGLDYGWSRVVCGFHYPSDTEAGRTGGRLVAAALMKDPDFVARLNAVAPQLRKALGL